MSREVGLVTCSAQAGDPDADLLLEALAERGVAARWVAWDEPGVDWAGFAASVVRSTWDYTGRREEFLAWARGVPRLFNPYPVIEYSTDKHYLAHLAARGVRIVETRFCDVGATPELFDGDLVVKPAVGAGSLGARRFSAGEADAAREHVARLHADGRDALIQPYVASVDDRGEWALVYVDGAFSHSMVKGAMLNVPEDSRDALYRVEAMSRVEAPAEVVAFGDRVLAAAGFPDLLYGRVDVVGTPIGWAVMELELVEPSLFLVHHPPTAHRLAAAVARRVG